MAKNATATSLVAPSAVPSSLNTVRLLDAIKKCCSYLAQALQVTFEAVANFAQRVWGGIQQGGVFIDIILRNLLRLEKHINDIANAMQKNEKTFAAHQIIPFLYEVEAQLTHYMITNRFFSDTFGWLVKGILSLVRYVRSHVVVL